ncbi:claudin-10-like isoform X6 [Brachyhypopomus gauderio]|uniref:claudin-10-like isoform X6 n=1 Tax=Brachyhypopomus gauderio TaxID=698409 RepID=UPI004042F5F0
MLLDLCTAGSTTPFSNWRHYRKTSRQDARIRSSEKDGEEEGQATPFILPCTCPRSVDGGGYLPPGRSGGGGAIFSYIQVCRGLMISAVCLGFFATACALVGMKCTKIGGNDQVKARIACFAGFQFFVSGLCSLTACSLYAHRITSEFFDPMFMAQKYELGAALFIGWGGSALCILGGVVFFLSLSDSISKSSSQADKRRYLYSADSYVSSHGKIHNQLANGRRPPAHYSSTSQQFDKHAYV